MQPVVSSTYTSEAVLMLILLTYRFCLSVVVSFCELQCRTISRASTPLC